MPDLTIKRALVAVYDKTGIIDFTRALVEEFGVEIVSTGGTARHLTEAGIPVTLVEEVTGFPEMLDGRVKTLHPKIHAAILADRDNPEHMRQLAEQGIEPIDMVVVNLYPFEETVKKPGCTIEEAIEMIDIGGPCLLRAAAKNYKHVHIETDPNNYKIVLYVFRKGFFESPRGPKLPEFSEELKQKNRMDQATCNGPIFSLTSRYDRRVSDYLGYELEKRQRKRPEALEALNDPFYLPDLLSGLALRYGENPHQAAQIKASAQHLGQGLVGALIAGPEPSYNNYSDGDAALELCRDLTRAFTPGGVESFRPLTKDGMFLAVTGERVIGPTTIPSDPSMDPPAVCVFVKHANACGSATAEVRVEAYKEAYCGDPNAAMGGVLVVNFVVDKEFASQVMNTYQTWGKDAGVGGFFLEAWLAPQFEEDAVAAIKESKSWGQRVRLFATGDMRIPSDETEFVFRSISGGVLIQKPDIVGLNEDQWKVVTDRAPSEQEMADLRLAWLVCKHTKSNAISICRDGTLIGNGAGQMSRVMSCRIATWLAKENGHEEKLAGAVAASDAFFPFRDGPDILADAGVTAIIQPGGSKRDAETIVACNERGLAMIFTGTRHFKH